MLNKAQTQLDNADLEPLIIACEAIVAMADRNDVVDPRIENVRRVFYKLCNICDELTGRPIGTYAKEIDAFRNGII